MRVFVFLHVVESREIGPVHVRYVPLARVDWRCLWVHDEFWMHAPGGEHVQDDEGARAVVVEHLTAYDPYPYD